MGCPRAGDTGDRDHPYGRPERGDGVLGAEGSRRRDPAVPLLAVPLRQLLRSDEVGDRLASEGVDRWIDRLLVAPVLASTRGRAADCRRLAVPARVSGSVD